MQRRTLLHREADDKITDTERKKTRAAMYLGREQLLRGVEELAEEDGSGNSERRIANQNRLSTYCLLLFLLLLVRLLLLIFLFRHFVR